jgi:hypothetical protein
MGKYIPVEPEKWAEMVKAMAEVTRLKAEVERLEQEVKYWRIEAETDNARWLRVLEDVERLRKAGDAMEQEVIGCYFEQDDPADSESLRAWRAAKEGKPSV